ncbi:MAG: dockerin type I repeat-containing protein [Porcipelethomonas sp.]
MKKMKKTLAVLSSLTLLLGTTGMTTFASETTSDDIPSWEQALLESDDDPSWKEEILERAYAVKELLAENGIVGEEADKMIEQYIDGSRKIAASQVTQDGVERDYFRHLLDSDDTLTWEQALLESDEDPSWKEETLEHAYNIKAILAENGVVGEAADKMIVEYMDASRELEALEASGGTYIQGITRKVKDERYYQNLLDTGHYWDGYHWVKPITYGRTIVYTTYTENSGVIRIDPDDPNNVGLEIEGEATYEYDPETKNLIIGGDGLLDTYGYGSLINSFDVRSVVIEKDVIIQILDDEYNSFFWSVLTMPEEHRNWRPVYTYEDSDLVEKYNTLIDLVCEESGGQDRETVKGWFPLNILPEGTDPHTVYNDRELPPVHEPSIYGDFDDSYGNTLLWEYDPGYSLMIGCIGTFDADAFIDSFTERLGDKIANFSVEEIYLNTERITIPGFEDDEEGAKEYILGLIEQKKAEFSEAAAEETEVTEATEATEATEPTEESILAKMIENTVIKIADKAEEDTADAAEEIAKLFGDVNGDDELDVRDAAFIAKEIAGGKASALPDTADYNKDGKKNVRDAAAMAKDIASGRI